MQDILRAHRRIAETVFIGALRSPDARVRGLILMQSEIEPLSWQVFPDMCCRLFDPDEVVRYRACTIIGRSRYRMLALWIFAKMAIFDPSKECRQIALNQVVRYHSVIRSLRTNQTPFRAHPPRAKQEGRSRRRPARHISTGASSVFMSVFYPRNRPTWKRKHAH